MEMISKVYVSFYRPIWSSFLPEKIKQRTVSCKYMFFVNIQFDLANRGTWGKYP